MLRVLTDQGWIKVGWAIGLKAEIEALPSPRLGEWGYSSDSKEIGTYNGATWDWGKFSDFLLASSIDTDGALTANSDSLVPSQQAVREFVEAALEALDTGGGGDLFFFVDGPLAISANASYTHIVTRDFSVQEWYIYAENTGSSGTTIVDINVNGSTIFSDPADRPEILFSETGAVKQSGVPLTSDFVAGDVITISIEGIAVGSSGLSVAGKLATSAVNVVAANSAETDTGTEAEKFLTPAGVAGSHKIPHETPGTVGSFLRSDGVDWVSEVITGSMKIGVSGGGVPPTIGPIMDFEVTFDMELTSWKVLADQSGSIEFDIWKDVYANYPPTVADTIVASNPPLIASATKNSGDCTGWTTSLSAGDIIRVNLNSVENITRATLEITYERR